MPRLLFVCICMLPVLMPALAQENTPIIPDIGALFDDTEGTFILYDSQNDVTIHYNAERAAQQFPPCSTFKIIAAAIALDSETIPDENFLIELDTDLYPLDHLPNTEQFTIWRQDNTLRSAVRYSVVWYFVELAHLIGNETFEHYFDIIDYGNTGSFASIPSPK
jgi:beta-lactamase class D